jgi:tripeptide aminopeptidase
MLAEDLAPGLLECFTRYVRIDTQSRRGVDDSPSTAGQIELGKLLVAELKAAGVADAQLEAAGYVTGTLPATDGSSAGGQHPVIGLIAHMDTSPDAPGAGVEPIVHRNSQGGVIELPRGGTRLDPTAMPELGDRLGHDLVTASGDTLLGADDKAGVAEIMTAAAYLIAHPELPRPTLRICFTPDEEIGRGALSVDLERLGAACAYTIDGSEIGELQDESFSADEVTITITGVDVHPGQATGRLVNALRLAARVIAELPADRLTPETTAGREGFIHPTSLIGTPARAQLTAIVRDFDDELLARHVALLEQTARTVVATEARAELSIEVRRQYRNMRRYLDAVPEVLAAAEQAIRAEGINPRREPIRGGTDGSLLSELGLPTPNIFAGGHEFHSVREWVSLQDMAAAAATIVHLAGMWTRPEYAETFSGRSVGRV